jgi:hypothetical protein
MDLLSATRSLVTDQSRYGDDRKSTKAGQGFALALDQLKPAVPVDTKPIIDGLPVEPRAPKNEIPISDRPEVPDDNVDVDPQILLTQKLAASMIALFAQPIPDGLPVLPIRAA